MSLRARVLEVSASPAEMQDYFEAQGFTDGLPVVPPTEDLVSAMIEASGLPGDTELAVVAMPLWSQLSGAALATGRTMAADPRASRPPANIPYRPRRTVVADICIESLLRSAIDSRPEA